MQIIVYQASVYKFTSLSLNLRIIKISAMDNGWHHHSVFLNLIPRRKLWIRQSLSLLFIIETNMAEKLRNSKKRLKIFESQQFSMRQPEGSAPSHIKQVCQDSFIPIRSNSLPTYGRTSSSTRVRNKIFQPSQQVKNLKTFSQGRSKNRFNIFGQKSKECNQKLKPSSSEQKNSSEREKQKSDDAKLQKIKTEPFNYEPSQLTSHSQKIQTMKNYYQQELGKKLTIQELQTFPTQQLTTKITSQYLKADNIMKPSEFAEMIKTLRMEKPRRGKHTKQILKLTSCVPYRVGDHILQRYK